MINIIDIVRSWYKDVNHTAEEKALAATRMKVCDECPSKIKSSLFSYTCSDCGCPLSKKQWSFFPCDKWVE